jgi:alpha-tubulin suppressor-like RCC1 family protein
VKTRPDNVFLPLLLMGVMGVLSLMLAGRLAAQTVTGIAVGQYHSLFVKSDGTLWGMGNNGDGRLGLGSVITDVEVPTEITNGVGSVAAGYLHSLFERNNALWAMGYDYYGQLGDGTSLNHYVPEQVVLVSPRASISALAAGAYHSLFATTQYFTGTGTDLQGAGWNATGQLGDGTYDNHYTFESIYPVSSGSISAVAGGYDHSLFVLPNGSLWGMGDNTNGELGIGLLTHTNLPEMIVPGGVTAVAAGDDFSLFLKSDGTLWGMGNNQYSELGLGSEYFLPPSTTAPLVIFSNLIAATVVAVAAGANDAFCITSDGILWGAGDNTYGELGQGTAGDFQFGIWMPIARNVVAVAAGPYDTLFIKSDGSLWGMGQNSYGELGTGDNNERSVPVEILPPPPPAITGVSVAGSQVVVTWPTNQAGFQLQSTASLGPSAAWHAVSPGPSIVNGQYTVTNPLSASQQFYQLADNNPPSPSLADTTLPANMFGNEDNPNPTNNANLWLYTDYTNEVINFYFEYGLTTNYGSKSALTTVTSNGPNIGLNSVMIFNLSANTTYHIQAISYVGTTTNYGGDLTFTTQ